MDNSIDNQEEYCLISSLTQIDICSLIDTKQDFSDGKTTARDWLDIEKDLYNLFDL